MKYTLLQCASICPLKSVTTPNCSQVKTLVRAMSTQMSFTETVYDSLCSNSFVMIMQFNQLLDMPHLSGGCIILTKDKILTNRDVNTFLVTDPSGTVIMHTWPLFPLISNCIRVPFVHHCPVDYCYNVRWSCEILWLSCHLYCADDYGSCPVLYHCALVLFIRGTPRTFVWVSTLCFVYVFGWSSSPCLSMARCH
jgi:hypothetical protein